MPNNDPIASYDATQANDQSLNLGGSTYDFSNYMGGTESGIDITNPEKPEKPKKTKLPEQPSIDYSDYYSTSKEDTYTADPTIEPAYEDPTANLQQQAAQQEREEMKAWAKVNRSRHIPFIAEGDYSDQPSADPRVIQDNFQSGINNWWDDFVSSYNDVLRSMDISDYADTQNRIDEIDEQLEQPGLPQEEEQRLLNNRAQAEWELEGIDREVSEHDEKIAERKTTLPYELKKKIALADEGTGNPFIPSEYGFGTFVGYESAELIGGSAFDWGIQVAAAIGPKVIPKLALKAMGSLGVAGPYGSAIAAGIGVATFLASAFGMYKMREHESKAEAGGAYEEKIKGAYREFAKSNNRQPNEEEARELRMQSHEGLEELRKANMTLMFDDAFQVAMLALPWSKALGKAFGPRMLRKVTAGFGSATANMVSEAGEEGRQFVWNEQYKDGTLQDIWETKGALGTYFDTSTRVGKAIFGVGSQDLLDSKEFREAMRSGAIMGWGISSVNSTVASARDIFSTLKTEKEVKHFMDLETEDNKDSYRHGMIQKFLGIGKNIGATDKVSNLVYGRDRSQTFIDLMNELKGSKFAQEHDISNQDIDREISAFEGARGVYRAAQTNKNISELSEGELVYAATQMANLSKHFSDYKAAETEVEGELSSVLNKISGSAEDLGSGFTDMLSSKAKLQALRNKAKALTELDSHEIPLTINYTARYRAKLENEIRRLEREYGRDLDNAEFGAKDINSSFDEQLRDIHSRLFDNKTDKELHQEEYRMLQRNSAELAARASTAFKSDEQYQEEVDKSVEDALGGVIEESQKATAVDQELSAWASENKELPDMEVQAQAVEDYTEQKTEDYARSLFGIPINEEEYRSGKEAVTEEAQTGASLYTEPRTKSEAERDMIERYTNTTLTDSDAQTVFTDKGSNTVPGVFDGKTGTLSMNRETGNIEFTDVDNNVHQLASINSTSSMRQLGVTVLDKYMFDFELTGDGNTITIEDSRYTNIEPNPFDAVEIDKQGRATKVTLYNANNKKVEFTNPVLVNELASVIGVIDAVKRIAKSKIKEGNEDFVVVREPNTKKDYAVFDRAGKIHVKGKGSGNAYNRWVPPKTRRDIIKLYNEELYGVMNKHVEAVNLGLTEKEIKNEIRELDNAIRAATPAEINVTKSSAELSDVEGSEEKVLPEAIEPGTRGEIELTGQALTNERGLLIWKARQKAEESITSETEEGTEDTGKAGQSYIEMSQAVLKEREEGDRGLSAPAFAVSYYGRTESDYVPADQYYNDTDKYVTHNDTRDHSVSFEFDFDYRDFWDDNEEHQRVEKFLKSKDKFTEEEVNNFVQNNLPEPDSFFNIVDQIPIYEVIKDRDGKIIAKEHAHKSSYDNISIPLEIEEIEDSNKKAEARIEHIKNKKEETRSIRISVIKSLMKGETPTVQGLERGIGVVVRAPESTKDRNKKLTDVFPKEETDDPVLGIAQNNKYVKNSRGEIIGKGKPGNVFFETKQTVNGYSFNVKLNPAKLSDEHAKVLFRAVATAHLSRGGYKAEMSDSRVEGLTAGEVIRYLALEGPKTKVKVVDSTNEHLVPKQLYVEDKKLIFGQNSLDLQDRESWNDFSEGEITQFVEWAKAHKNYIADFKRLGTTFDSSFRIGSMEAKANETTYEQFLINNGLILTDVRKPYFHAPSLVFDINTLTSGEDISKSVLGTEYPTKPQGEETPVTTEPTEEAAEPTEAEPTEEARSESKTMFKAVESVDDIKALQPGTVLSVRAESNAVPEPIIRINDSNKVEVIMEGFNAVRLDPIKDLSVKNNESAQSITDLLKEVFPVSEIGYKYKKDVTDKFDDRQDNPPNVHDDPDEPSPLNRLRKFAPDEYEKIDVNKELKWLRKKLPQERVEVVDSLIKVISSGEESFGQTRSDMIILSRAAEYGTAFHEAFHRVFLSLLTTQQREEVYNRARRKYGMENASNRDVGEVLAERFREFVLTDNKDKFREPNPIKRFFQELWNMIYTLFTGDVKLNSLDIERLFSAIEQGRFKFSRPKSKKRAPILKGTQAYLNSQGYSSDMQSTITRNLVFKALNMNGIRRVDDVKDINFDVVKGDIARKYNDFKYKTDYFGQLVEQSKDQKRKDYYDGQRAEAERLADLYSDIIDDFDYFQSLAEEYLQAMNIIRTKEDYLDYEYTGGKGQSEFEKYNKAPFQFDGRNNIRSDIKMLVMTLPDSAEKDSHTSMHKFVDFTPTWNKVLHDFHNATTVTEMMEGLKSRMTNNTPYQVLYKRLSEGDENLKTQFHSSVRMHKNDFINSYFDDRRGRFRLWFGDAEIRSAARSNVSEWGQRLASSDLVTKEGNISLEKMKEYNKMYNSLINKADRVSKVQSEEELEGGMKSSIDLLNNIGIPIDKDKLLYILDQDEKSSSKYSAFRNFVDRIGHLFNEKGTLYQAAKGNYPTRSSGEKFDNEDLLQNESAARDFLGEHFATYDPASLSPVVLGPAGNPYFKYMPNSYMTDAITKIGKSRDFVEKLLSSTFNKNSYILNQLYVDADVRARFKIDTFSAFVRTYADQGRSYEAVNAIEDFIARLHAISSNKLPLPTLADRSSFYYFRGIDPVNISFTVTEEGKLKLPPNSPIIKIIADYIRDEENRIQQTKDQVDEAIETGYSRDLIENYHYRFSSSLPNSNYIYEHTDRGMYKLFKDEKGNYLGNGTRFNHFDELNKERKGSIEEDATDVIVESIKDTIKLANGLGVINTSRSNNKLIVEGNNYIDFDLVDKVAEDKYGGNSNIAIKDIIANYAVNNIISTIETDKILLDDPAFYEGDADKVKRSTVLASTGTNLRIDFPENHELHNQTTYNSLTLNSSTIKSVYYNQLKKKYVDQLVEQGVEKDKAESTATKKLSEFQKVDQTDAQVFISPEMYRSLRMRMGEWYPKDETALRALQDETEPSKDVIMPPLKLVYFGPSFERGMSVPIFNKMSMAALDRQLVEGTELEELLDRMELKGEYAPGKSKNPNNTLKKIHQVKFDTATKVGNRERFQFFADSEGETINDLSKAPVFPEHFEYLRRQTITEPHEEAHITLGTQVKKVPMYNVDKNSQYNLMGKPVSGNYILRTINRSIGRLSDMGVARLMEDIGIDPISGAVQDETKLLEVLREDAVRSNSPNNIINALTPDESGNYPEFDSLPDRKWIENRVVSLINKRAVNLDVPGKPFIQMSNFGLRAKTAKSLSKFKDKITWLQAAKRDLRFYRFSEQGDLQAMDTIVSVSMFKNVIPNYKNLTFEQKKEFVKQNPRLLGYRVPTQGPNSVAGLRVVGLLPESYGDTIILPAEFTTLTGSDFDIDKLFTVRYNFETGLDGRPKLGNDGNPYHTPFLTDKEDEAGQLSTFDERIRKYAEKEGAAKEISEVNKAYGRTIKKIAKSRKDEVETLKEMRSRMAWLDDYLDIVDNEVLEEEFVNKKDTIDAIHGILQDLNQGIKDIEAKREEDIQGIVNSWIEQHREEFAKRDIVSQNTSEALQNLLIDSYTSILFDPKHVVQTYTPLDTYTAKLKAIAGEVESREETPKYYSLMPRFQIDAKSRYIEGKNLIGSFALSNVHHIMGQIADLYIAHDFGIKQKETLEKPIDEKFRDAYSLASELMYEYNVNGVLPDEYQGYIREVPAEEATEAIEKAKKTEVEGIPTDKLIDLARLGPKRQADILPYGADAVEYSSVISSYDSETLRRLARKDESPEISFEEAHWISANEEFASKFIDLVLNNEEYRNLSLQEAAMKLLYDNDAIETIDTRQTSLFEQDIPGEYVLSGTTKGTAARPEFDFNRFVKDYTSGDIEDRPANRTTNIAVQKGLDGEYVSDWMSAIISALVDIAKDPYIFDLNVNSTTQNVANLLLRAGLGEPSFYFTAQPILKDLAYYSSLVDQAGSGISGIKQKPVKQVRKIYKDLMKEAQEEESKKKISPRPVFGDVLSKGRLRADARQQTTKDSGYYGRQLEVLNKFQELKMYANALTDAIMVSRFDTQQWGKNLVEAKTYANKYNKVRRENIIKNFDRSFSDTFLGRYRDNTIPKLRTILKDKTVTSTEGFNSIHDQILKFSGALYTSDNSVINRVVNYSANELYSAFVSRFFSDPNYLGITSDKLNNLLRGKESVAKRVYNVKYESGDKYTDIRNNKLLSILQPRIASESRQFDALSTNTLDIAEKWDKDEVTRAWKELLSYPDEYIRKLGQDLVTYSFYTSGFNRNLNSFFEFIPFEYLRDIGFSDYVKWVIQDLNQQENFNEIMVDMLDEFYKQNWNNDAIVPEVSALGLKNTLRWGNKRVSIFTISDFGDLHRGFNEAGDPVFVPHVKTSGPEGTSLFEYVGYKRKGSEPVYRRVSKLGYYSRGYRVKEYGLKEGSIFEDNKVNLDNRKDGVGASLASEDIHLLQKNDKEIYSDFVSVSKEENIPSTYTKEDSPIAEYRSEEDYTEAIGGMDRKSEQLFKQMKLPKGSKEFSIEEIRKALPQLSEQEAETVRQGIIDGTINNNC